MSLKLSDLMEPRGDDIKDSTLHTIPFALPLPSTAEEDGRDPNPVKAPPIFSGASSNLNLPSGSGSPEPEMGRVPVSGARPVIRYRECLRNHAASRGGHVLDGCGEFMARGEEGTAHAFQCAACDCHRNFHRQEAEGEPRPGCPTSGIAYHPYPPRVTHPVVLPAPPTHQQLHLHQHGYLQPHAPTTAPPMAAVPPVMMAFGGCGAAAESSSEDFNAAAADQPPHFAVSAKKRHRTKFSGEQKERMMELAEKLQWKIQKQDEQRVQQFCSEVGVKRKVFKVWMHNNKQAERRKQ